MCPHGGLCLLKWLVPLASTACVLGTVFRYQIMALWQRLTDRSSK